MQCRARLNNDDNEVNVISPPVIDCLPKNQSISIRKSTVKISQNKLSSKVAVVHSCCCCCLVGTLTTILLLGIISISQMIILALSVNGVETSSHRETIVAAQDVDLNLPLELPFSGQDNDQVVPPPPPSTRFSRSKVKNLDEFLENLPILSVGQKHRAKFDCELSSELETFRLIWLRLSRAPERDRDAIQDGNETLSRGNSDDTMLISLNQKIITPDRRFKVHRLSALRWTLSVDNVNANDGEAYYLCQVSSTSSSSDASSINGMRQENLGSWFVGGARLNVLVPPKIVENETSPSLVQANEYENLTLRCKVTSEPQAQLMWKREDGLSLDDMDVEQKFRHETKREKLIIKATLKPYFQIISIDSSELIFEPFRRHQAAAYLCIASNGVQPGVSQRINVLAVNCRTNSVKSSPNEPCDSESRSVTRTRTADSDDASNEQLNNKGFSLAATTTLAPTGIINGRRKVWSSKSSLNQSTSGKLDLQRRLLADQQRADKRKAANKSRNDLLASQISIRRENHNNKSGNEDTHSRWQQETPNKANGLLKDLHSTTSRALISLFLFLVITAI